MWGGALQSLTTTAAAINVLDGRSTASPTVTHIAATTIAAAVGAVFYDCRGANCCGKGTLLGVEGSSICLRITSITGTVKALPIILYL